MLGVVLGFWPWTLDHMVALFFILFSALEDGTQVGQLLSGAGWSYMVWVKERLSSFLSFLKRWMLLLGEKKSV